MTRVGFSYTIYAELLFTADEVRNMMQCSAEHYDGVCRFARKPGGFLYGLYNRYVDYFDEENKKPTRLGFIEVDTLCKILEGPGANLDLAWKLKQILKDINEEAGRISELTE